MEKINIIRKALKERKGRSAWDKAITVYALEILDNVEKSPENRKLLEKQLLNGAENWHQYSQDGCSLIYDEDIAKRICTPSELKRTQNGRWNFRKGISWLTLQGYLLEAATYLIFDLYEI